MKPDETNDSDFFENERTETESTASDKTLTYDIPDVDARTETESPNISPTHSTASTLTYDVDNERNETESMPFNGCLGGEQCSTPHCVPMKCNYSTQNVPAGPRREVAVKRPYLFLFQELPQNLKHKV